MLRMIKKDQIETDDKFVQSEYRFYILKSIFLLASKQQATQNRGLDQVSMTF